MNDPFGSYLIGHYRARVAAAFAAPLLMLALSPAGFAAAAAGITITVDSSADAEPPDTGDGACTLREAIIASNTNTDTDTCPAGTTRLDTINFSGVTTISTVPGTPLPAITAPVIIDGEIGGNPGVTLAGPGAADIGLQLAPGSKGSTLKGLRIAGYSTGINLSGGGATLTNNWIGTANGTTASPNILGILVASPANRIGLPGAGRNLISGNMFGLYINGPKTIVQNNWVGLNSAGTAALSTSGSIGINVVGSGTLIGGTKPGQGNVVSGGSQGIYLTGGASKTRVQRNFIGTNADGTAVVGIATGIVDSASQGTLIGGPMPAASNLIAGVVGGGIEFYDNGVSSKSFTTVTGNIFGLSSAGLPLINGSAIQFELTTSPIKVRITNNLIANSTLAGINVNVISTFSPNLTGSTGNCLYDNADGFVVNIPSTSITFKNNWWGDSTGPGGVYPGSGDTVGTSLVLANPFLKTPPAACLGWAPRSYKPASGKFANASTKPTTFSSARVPTASTYTIAISLNPNVSAPFDGAGLLSAPKFITSAPLGFGRYYWQVITDVPDTGQSWKGPANVYYVTIHKSPKPGVTVKPGNVKFIWAKQTGASTYQLDWFNNATCTGIGTTVSPISGLTTTVPGLTAGDYSWQVTAIDIAGTPMPCWSFKVQ